MRKSLVLSMVVLLLAAGTVAAERAADTGYTIEFIGLAHFHDTKAGTGLVLVPDGRAPGGGIPSHTASFYVETASVVRADGWAAEADPVLGDIGVSEFAIAKPSRITISGLEGAAATARASHTLPKLARVRIAPERAETIAQIPYGRRTPEAFRFGGGIAARLRVPDHSEPITITAVADDGSETKTLTLRAGTEIVFGNLPVAFTRHSHGPDDSHFQIYAKLDAERSAGTLKEPPRDPRLEPLPSRHPYLRFLSESTETFANLSCTPTCCASNWP